jgi:hypothetical protein
MSRKANVQYKSYVVNDKQELILKGNDIEPKFVAGSNDPTTDSLTGSFSLSRMQAAQIQLGQLPKLTGLTESLKGEWVDRIADRLPEKIDLVSLYRWVYNWNPKIETVKADKSDFEVWLEINRSAIDPKNTESTPATQAAAKKEIKVK